MELELHRECPHCKKDLKINSAAYHNVLAYNQVVLAIALCCGKGIQIKPVQLVDVTEYVGNRTVDDWGNILKKEKQNG